METLIDELAERDLLSDAAGIVDEFWEDDYTAAAVKSGRADYSILDFAADVIREATEEQLIEIRGLLS